MRTGTTTFAKLGKLAAGGAVIALAVLVAAALLRLPELAARVGPRAGTDAGWAQGVKEARLELAVRLALLERFRADGLRVGVEVRGGEVILSGRVHERSTRELAEEVVRSVAGVERVDDRVALLVEEGAQSSPVSRAAGDMEREVADAVLESRVKLRLIDRLGGDGFRLEVEATDGVVTLRGTVGDQERRRSAVETARSTPGVGRLIDLVTVK